MLENDVKNSGFQWDEYWSNGNIHSLSNAFNGNYKGAIEKYWKDKFSELPANAKILDIGTGNGAVAFIAAEVSEQKQLNFTIKAIDLAKIDPQGATKSYPELSKYLSQIEFQGQVSADQTPFENHYFDLIVGQYALEYTPLTSTIKELRRILKPSGQLKFIMHHADSIVMQTTRDELAQTKLIFEHSNIFELTRSLINTMGEITTLEQLQSLRSDLTVESIRKDLKQALMTLEQEARKRTNPFFLLTVMEFVSALFDQKNLLLPLNKKLTKLKQSEQLIKRNQERIQNLFDVCFNSSRSDEFNQQCLANQFSQGQFSPFYDDNKQLIGYTFETS